jgi:hypothetical protein
MSCGYGHNWFKGKGCKPQSTKKKIYFGGSYKEHSYHVTIHSHVWFLWRYLKFQTFNQKAW